MSLFRAGKPRVRVIRTSDQEMAGLTGFQPIEWQAVAWSEGEPMWSAASPTEVVIPRTGTWFVGAQLSRANTGSPVADKHRVLRNGGFVSGTETPDNNVNSRWIWSTVERLDANDVITLSYVAAPMPSSGGRVRPMGTSLTLVRLGPELWT